MKILINRSDAIGDSLLTMPMAARIKEDFPQSEIIFIISKRSVDIFKNNPYVDDIWVLDNDKNFISRFSFLWKKFQKFTPDAFFHVGGSFLPAIIAWIKRLKFRGGLKTKWPSFILLNKGVHQMRSFVAQHESDYNLNLLESLGIQYDFNKRSQYAPLINLGKKDIFDNYQQFLKNKKIDPNKPLIFIHPGMSGHTLNWSSRNYGRFIARLEKRFPGKFTYVVSYTPSDENFLIGLRSYLSEPENKELNDSIVYFDGSQKGLYHYMTILANACLFIGPSTGTTHIANALGIKLVTLYSPIKVQSANRWSPFNREVDSTRVLIPDVICGEHKACAGRACPYYECMAKIEVNDVVEEAIDVGQLAKI